jgi:hypothetical protein
LSRLASPRFATMVHRCIQGSGADFCRINRISASINDHNEKFTRADRDMDKTTTSTGPKPYAGKESSHLIRPAQLKTNSRSSKRAAVPAPLAILTRTDTDPRREGIDRRRAVLRALEIIASSSRALEPGRKHGAVAKRVGLE